jgi:hypothetical protein
MHLRTRGLGKDSIKWMSSLPRRNGQERPKPVSPDPFEEAPEDENGSLDSKGSSWWEKRREEVV